MASDSDNGGDSRLRTIKSAAQILDVSIGTIYQLGRDGAIELLKIGKRSTRVTQSSLDKYVANAKRVSKRKD